MFNQSVFTEFCELQVLKWVSQFNGKFRLPHLGIKLTHYQLSKRTRQAGEPENNCMKLYKIRVLKRCLAEWTSIPFQPATQRNAVCDSWIKMRRKKINKSDKPTF